MSGKIRRFKRYPAYKDSGVEWHTKPVSSRSCSRMASDLSTSCERADRSCRGGGVPPPRERVCVSEDGKRCLIPWRIATSCQQNHFSAPLGMDHFPVLLFSLWQCVHSPWNCVTNRLSSPREI